jgi:hypothetical protein
MLILLSTLGMVTDDMLNKSHLAPFVKPLAPATYNVISVVVPGAGKYVDDVGALIERAHQ